MWTCTGCDEANPAGADTCGVCGGPGPFAPAPVAGSARPPGPVAFAPPAPVAAPGPPRRRVGLVVALVLVAILGGVAAGLALTRGSGDDEVVAGRPASGEDEDGAAPSAPEDDEAEGDDAEGDDGGDAAEAAETSTTAPPATLAVPRPTTGGTRPAGGAGTTVPAAGAEQWMTALITYSDASDAETWRAAHAPDASIVATSSYASLTPGYHVVALGPFGSGADALQACLDRGLTTRQQCFAAPLSQDPADRSVRLYPDA